ncbi:DNA mismatch repair endonuclease MutL [Candidatus Thorarchaeota archaeon]|nr:MAG: DNA mismatch repair endonuclease MutL [Candidatus Thorarchaeota archaeon]
MGKIEVLDNSLISLISAGEVVENPASIVKELIENSLDANATSITIEIESGGIERINVSDNGEGILKEDAPLCALRHSTSKIRTKEDIESVRTYGFRGEALASIASMANVVITSRHIDEQVGSRIESKAGGIPSVSDAARPAGTTVTVTNLFENVPARRKHLSNPRVESHRVYETVAGHAIIRNDVGFRLIRDGNLAFECPPNQTPRDRVLCLWGSDIAKHLIDFQHEENGVVISGFVAKPPISRGNRGREYFSVRKRPITDDRLSLAVEQAYSTLLMKGRFPVCCIDIGLDPKMVDANVHPTKREVRVQDIDKIVTMMREAVERAIGKASYQEGKQNTLERRRAPSESATETGKQGVSPTSMGISAQQKTVSEQLVLDSQKLEPDILETMDEIQGAFRILGQFQNLYLLVELDDNLLLIDQHAAHERILYEQLKSRVQENRIPIQELLEPLVLELSPPDKERILDISHELHELGFSVGNFGGNEILVSTLPDVFGSRATREDILAFVDRLLEIDLDSARQGFMDSVMRITACHSAIRAGQGLNNQQISNLLTELLRTPNKFNCCHGRPSILYLSKKSLDKAFGRTGPEAIARFIQRHGHPP